MPDAINGFSNNLWQTSIESVSPSKEEVESISDKISPPLSPSEKQVKAKVISLESPSHEWTSDVDGMRKEQPHVTKVQKVGASLIEERPLEKPQIDSSYLEQIGKEKLEEKLKNNPTALPEVAFFDETLQTIVYVCKIENEYFYFGAQNDDNNRKNAKDQISHYEGLYEGIKAHLRAQPYCYKEKLEEVYHNDSYFSDLITVCSFQKLNPPGGLLPPLEIILPLSVLKKKWEEGNQQFVLTYFQKQAAIDPFAIEKFDFFKRSYLTQDQINQLFIEIETFDYKKQNSKFCNFYIHLLHCIDVKNPKFACQLEHLINPNSFYSVYIDVKLLECIEAIMPSLMEEHIKGLLKSMLDSYSFYASSNREDLLERIAVIEYLLKKIPKLQKVSPEHYATIVSAFIKSISECCKEEYLQQYKAEFLHVFKLLLTYHPDLNAKDPETRESLLETLYFYEGKRTQDLQPFLLTCFKWENSPTITDRMKPSMKRRFYFEGDTKWQPYLIAQGVISQEAQPQLNKQVQTGSLEDYRCELLKGEEVLSNYLNGYQYRLNPELIPLDDIQSLQTLKKEIKQFLAKEKTPPQDIQDSYQKFCERYDCLVNRHPFLRYLREVSTEVREIAKSEHKQQSPSEKLKVFYSYWGEDQAYTNREVDNRIRKIFSVSRPLIWSEMRQQAIKSAETVRKNPWLKNILWNHGTNSSALPPILKTKKLDSKGNLIKEGVPTFSGESCGSEIYINNRQLSGEYFSRQNHTAELAGKSKYKDESLEFYHGATTRFMVNVLYATQKQGYHHEQSFDRAHILQRLSLSTLQHYVWGDMSIEKRKAFEEDIRRLKGVGGGNEEPLVLIKHSLEEWLKENTLSPEQRKKAVDLLDHLNQSPSHVFTDEESIRLIEQGYPIIFGATSVDAKEKYEEKGGWFSSNLQEFLAEGPLPLGTKVQAAFTPSEHVEDLKHLMEKENTGVGVFDMETGFYLETRQLIKGEKSLFVKESDSFSVQQQKLAEVLQREVLPEYAIPFPEHPFYETKQGEKVFIDTPLFGQFYSAYEAYKAHVEKGGETRHFHGPLHAARTALWTQLLLTVYKTAGRDTSKINPFLLGFGGGDHDVERLDDGLDRWDKQSAAKFKLHCQQLALPSTLERYNLPVYVDAIANKDHVRPEDSDIKRIIHDADCLEIVRCLKQFSDFEKHRLCFVHFPSLKADYQEKLISEIAQFIQLTEEPKMKWALEVESTNCYADLCRLIGKLHQEKQLFPTLFELLKEVIESFPQEERYII